ncbi:MAG: NosD domain-containing protein [Candidatus Odinarchaeota archaeon]
MKSKNKIKHILLTLLIILLGISILNLSNLNLSTGNLKVDKNLRLSKISDKISIDGNSDWIALKNAGNCTGSGITTDPYVIKNLIINGSGVGSCIMIQNTDVHFVILNCTIFNSGGLDIFDLDAGIKLLNASNGKFINNTLSNNNYGVYGEYSHNTVMIGNDIQSTYAIKLLYCNNSLAYFNNIKGTDINLFYQDMTLRFYSEQKMIFKYEGKTYKKYIGNYWKDYETIWSGTDNNNDGIGDVPIISGDIEGLVIDGFPLFYPIENYEIIGIGSEEAIPGYNLVYLFGIAFIMSIFAIKKKRNNLLK